MALRLGACDGLGLFSPLVGFRPCAGKPVCIPESFSAPMRAVNDSIISFTLSASSPWIAVAGNSVAYYVGVGTPFSTSSSADGCNRESRSENVASAAGAVWCMFKTCI